MDHRCLRRDRPTNINLSKVQTKGTSTKDPKDPKTEEPKPKESQGSNNSGNSLGNSGNTSVKKRKWGNRDQKKDSTPTAPTSGANATQATGNAVAALGGQKKKQQREGQGPRKDIFETTCYNCNKKGYYSRDFTKPKN